jgi:hypothetical protein
VDADAPPAGVGARMNRGCTRGPSRGTVVTGRLTRHRSHPTIPPIIRAPPMNQSSTASVMPGWRGNIRSTRPPAVVPGYSSEGLRRQQLMVSAAAKVTHAR